MGALFSKPKMPKVEPVRMPTQDDASRVEQERERLRKARSGGRSSTVLSGKGGGDYTSGALGS